MAAFSEIVIEQGATFSTTINVEDTAVPVTVDVMVVALDE